MAHLHRLRRHGHEHLPVVCRARGVVVVGVDAPAEGLGFDPVHLHLVPRDAVAREGALGLEVGQMGGRAGGHHRGVPEALIVVVCERCACPRHPRRGLVPHLYHCARLLCPRRVVVAVVGHVHRHLLAPDVRAVVRYHVPRRRPASDPAVADPLGGHRGRGEVPEAAPRELPGQEVPVRHPRARVQLARLDGDQSPAAHRACGVVQCPHPGGGRVHI
mmetsp:Transcript_660/g.2206  ORF Transcript_660/g.2206 Transcript_660/m.2206 type:complete len:217 (+) Transcript_660:1075-1725(+)